MEGEVERRAEAEVEALDQATDIVPTTGLGH